MPREACRRTDHETTCTQKSGRLCGGTDLSYNWRGPHRIVPRKIGYRNSDDAGNRPKTIEAIVLFLRGRDRVWEKQRGTQKAGSRDQALPITLSIGVAKKLGNGATLSLVIKSAYRARYEAKERGGNVVKRGEVAIDPARRSHAGSGRIVASGEYGT